MSVLSYSTLAFFKIAHCNTTVKLINDETMCYHAYFGIVLKQLFG